MLKPSDFNNAVPQFTNGNYASNPINPQYIAEPDAESYNRGTEPLQTLPAQWWNWFINKFTARFNKVNIYVKNIFNELAQVLSIFNITPDGTEQTPTTSQLKTVFECCYPQYVKSDLYGNTPGTALGVAAVGTATTFARSDHVHPKPTCIECAAQLTSTLSISGGGTGATLAANAFNNLISDMPEYCSPLEGTARVMLLRSSYCTPNLYKANWVEIDCFMQHITVACATCAANANVASSLLNTLTIDGGGTNATTAADGFNNLINGMPIYNQTLTGDACVMIFYSSACIPGQFKANWAQMDCFFQHVTVACATNATCAGVTCAFGNVIATKNPTMRTWSVYSLKSSSYESVPQCDIAKAICWATDNFAQGRYMSITGFMGCHSAVYKLQPGNGGVSVLDQLSESGTCDWSNLPYTCERGRSLPISISGSY